MYDATWCESDKTIGRANSDIKVTSSGELRCIIILVDSIFLTDRHKDFYARSRESCRVTRKAAEGNNFPSLYARRITLLLLYF